MALSEFPLSLQSIEVVENHVTTVSLGDFSPLPLQLEIPGERASAAISVLLLVKIHRYMSVG